MVQSALVSWRTQNVFHHALRIYTCVSVGSTGSHTYKNKIHNWYTVLRMFHKFRVPHSHNSFLRWVLKDTHKHIYTYRKQYPVCPKTKPRWEHCDNPSIQHHTHTENRVCTYLMLLMLPASDPSLHLSSWVATIWRSASSSLVRRSNWSSWNKDKDKMYVRLGKREQACKRQNWDFMLGSSSECKFC